MASSLPHTSPAPPAPVPIRPPEPAPTAPLRLALVTQDFPPDVGGTQTYAYELARRLAARCTDFAVIAPGLRGAAEADAALPFEVIRTGASANQLTVWAVATLMRLGQQRRFDASFHVQWSTAPAALTARRLGGPPRVYIAAHGRELLFEPRAPSGLRALYNRTRRRALTRADRLFPVSRFTGRLLEDLGVDPGDMTVLPNGTDPERFAQQDATALRSRLGLGDRPVLLTVSRLVQRKGIDTVIRALPAVRDRRPDVYYLVAGDGPDRERLEALATEAGVRDYVGFIGRISHTDLPLFYSACDVLVMPSRARRPDVEGFGIVFLEANACGKPVIGARSGGIPDAVVDGQTGLLVDPDDEQALAEAILRLLENPAFADRLGRQGRDRVLSEVNWDRIAHTLFAAITQNGV